MNFRIPFGSLFAIFILTASLHAQSREELIKHIEETPEWSLSGTAKQFDETNLDRFAGKAAPTIQRYGLKGVTVQDLTGPQSKVRLTLYEMVDASAAYGLFTLERDIEGPGSSNVAVGTEGFRKGTSTFFWQSKYVVKVDSGAEAAEAVAGVVSQNIFGRSRKPPVSDHLPLNNLLPGTDRYVVDAAGLPSVLGFDKEALGFEDDVEIATAQYRVNGKTANLVLLLYPTQQLAKKYAELWDGSSRADQQLRKRVGPLVAWVRGSRDPEVAQAILDSIGYETKVTWNQPRADISLSTLILTIFSFIGIALLFTLVVGLSFGGLRIFVKARYPDRVFDRAQDMEIIQLKLSEGLTRKEIGS
jgi:hypothetical protein